MTITTLILAACLALTLWAKTADASVAQVERAIRDKFGRHAGKALRVARCESRLHQYAVSRTGDIGAFQVNYSAHHRSGESFEQFRRRMSDLQTNVQFAFRLSRGGTDWGAWTCRWAA